jgi:hypothetical protein
MVICSMVAFIRNNKNTSTSFWSLHLLHTCPPSDWNCIMIFACRCTLPKFHQHHKIYKSGDYSRKVLCVNCAWKLMCGGSVRLSVVEAQDAPPISHVKFTATTVQINYGTHKVPSSAKVNNTWTFIIRNPSQYTLISYVICYKFLLHVSVIWQMSGRCNSYMWTAEGRMVDRSERKSCPLVGFWY